MRSQDEIMQQLRDRKELGHDPMGNELMEYIYALDLEHVNKAFAEMRPDEEPLKEHNQLYATDEKMLHVMQDYIDFAYNKIEQQRGLSAERSVLHYIAWLWLIGNDALYEKADAMYQKNYRDYGRPIIDMIADHYGWPKVARDESLMPARNAELVPLKLPVRP